VGFNFSPFAPELPRNALGILSFRRQLVHATTFAVPAP